MARLEQCVLGRFDWTSLDQLACGLGFKHRRFLRKGIDALTSFRRRLLDHDELRETGNQKRSRFLELLVRDGRQPFEYISDVLLAETIRVPGELFNQLRLRHEVCHWLFSKMWLKD